MASNLDDFQKISPPSGTSDFKGSQAMHDGLLIYACQYVGPETDCIDLADSVCGKFNFTSLVGYKTINAIEMGRSPETHVWKWVRNTGAPPEFVKVQGGLIITGRFLSNLKCSK